MSRAEVFQLIADEREYQDKVWPKAGLGVGKQTPTEFAVYMEQYLREGFAHVTHNPGHEGLLSAIRKVTALGVACMEEFGAPARPRAQIANARSRR